MLTASCCSRTVSEGLFSAGQVVGSVFLGYGVWWKKENAEVHEKSVLLAACELIIRFIYIHKQTLKMFTMTHVFVFCISCVDCYGSRCNDDNHGCMWNILRVETEDNWSESGKTFYLQPSFF